LTLNIILRQAQYDIELVFGTASSSVEILDKKMGDFKK